MGRNLARQAVRLAVVAGAFSLVVLGGPAAAHADDSLVSVGVNVDGLLDVDVKVDADVDAGVKVGG